MSVKIDYRVLELFLQKSIVTQYKRKAGEIAEKKFEKVKEAFLTSFMEDDITQEIKAGENENKSILQEETKGNLFSFIGFTQGEKPIEDLYKFLNDHIYIDTENPTYDNIRKKYTFKIYAPDKDSIKDATPMPWGTGRSWVYGIESGIIGLNHYLSINRANELDLLAGKNRERTSFGPTSFSTTAIQVAGTPNPGIQYTAHKYLSSLFNEFINNLKRP